MDGAPTAPAGPGGYELMPMREECKHFQSRTYASGEVARFCVLDLAPEAPWRCPDNCPAYERRMADAGWAHGSLIEPAIEEEPNLPGPEAAHLLDEAEDIVNSVGASVAAEIERERERRAATAASPWWRRWRRGR